MPARASLLELTQASASVTVDGVTSRREVTLPYIWDIANAGSSGDATFELSFDLPAPVVDSWGIYLPSVGNVYEIWLNGALLQRQGHLSREQGSDYAKVPRYVGISPGQLRASNQLHIHIHAEAGRRGGLSALTMGPQDEVAQLYQIGYLLRGTGSLVVVAFSLVVALLSLALWATQIDPSRAGRSKRDPLYLYAAVAEFCWTVAVGDALIDSPILPWPWWGVMTAAAAAAWACNMVLFCVEVAGWSEKSLARWFRLWLIVLMGFSVVLPLMAANWNQPIALSIWHGLLSLTFLSFGAVFLWHTKRGSSRAHWLVAMALCFNLLVGVWDLYTFRVQPTFPDNSLLRFSSLFFGMSLAYIVLSRFQTASAQVRNLLSSLTQRVSQKEIELQQSYSRLEILARDQARSAERTRILRDMHDGVGSHISAAIRQLQSGRASSGEVLQTLRDSLDQLKLSIDAMSLPDGDVNALLASLRYRLAPRFAAMDIELAWDVDLLPVLGRLDASAMRQLQYMLFEALSNVLQHAQAKVLRIEAHARPAPDAAGDDGVCLRVVDNGCGFDAGTAHGKGLAGMQERAWAIGAQLIIASQSGQTAVEILLGPDATDLAA